MGPSGIMSLDSFGDVVELEQWWRYMRLEVELWMAEVFLVRGPGQSERDFDRQKANQRAALQIAERAQAKNLGYNERAKYC